MRPDLRFRLAGLAAVTALAIAVAVVVDVPTVEELRRSYAGTGLLGGLLFAALYAVLSLLPLPAAVLTIAAGAVFGLPRGLPIVLLGATVGAGCAFYLGRDAVQHFTGARLQTVDAFLTRRGFWAVLVARLIPIVPFNALNYLSGLTAVRARSYLAATMLGILPGTTAYVAVGAYGHRPGSWPFLAALAGLLLLTVIGVVGSRVRSRRARRTEAPDLHLSGTSGGGEAGSTRP